MIIAATERISLRHFHIGDIDAMEPLFSDPLVMQYGPGPQARAWTIAWLRGCLEDYYVKWGFGLWAITVKQYSGPIGFCGLTLYDDIDGHQEFEIGCRIRHECWGQGLATAAASLTQQYAFEALGIRRLVSLIDRDNTRSIRVATKCGLAYEKAVTFRGKPIGLYSISKANSSS